MLYSKNIFKHLNLDVSEKKKKAFTLIELVAVLAIIAILSAALAPKVSSYITESKKVGVLNEAKSIVTAYEAVNYKSPTLSESSTVADILSKAGDLLSSDDIKKIPGTFTISQCKQILDTENYSFTLTDGIASSPSKN